MTLDVDRLDTAITAQQRLAPGGLRAVPFRHRSADTLHKLVKSGFHLMLLSYLRGPDWVGAVGLIMCGMG
jgi:hypothetical protein